MKDYRGLVRIICTRKTGCLRNLKKNVAAGCMDCPDAETQIVNLDGRVIYKYRSPEIKTGKRINLKEKTEVKYGI